MLTGRQLGLNVEVRVPDVRLLRTHSMGMGWELLSETGMSHVRMLSPQTML